MHITKTNHLHYLILFAICDQVSTFVENQDRIVISEISSLHPFLVADVNGLQALLLAAHLLLLLPLLGACPLVGGEEHPVDEVGDAGDGTHHGHQTERVADAHSADQKPA